MKVALVNPAWRYEGSIYFGCREPHLPLELGYAAALLRSKGCETLLLDGQLDRLSNEQLAEKVARFGPDMTVVATAPTYLFWRCAPPELAVPRAFLDALAGRGGTTVAVGPHSSATPGAALDKLGCDLVVRGECEEVLARLVEADRAEDVASLAFRRDGELVTTGAPAAVDMAGLPALSWPDAWIRAHAHHHHRFDRTPEGPGAEMEVSRGCPYACSFCAKLDFRDQYRRRPLETVLAEIDGLIAQGVRYIYFVDEIFLPWRELLAELAKRDVEFGVQTRIDLWKPDMLDRLGEAGCVSIEAGVESLTPEGRQALDKDCKLSTEELTERLIRARKTTPFVQANLIAAGEDDAETVKAWRERLLAAGVWANDPVPLYPYPSSPDYRKRWGQPDDLAWERAHEAYLAEFDRFSDIQEARPLPLKELEAACGCS
jgi:B12-binding domain/radical SAM domain protein of rhizo-twelve system